jgi:uncharacterized protein (TIGR02145 family)
MTIYYLRAYATNGSGTGFGDVISFTTQIGANGIIDNDGNSYKIITVGKQIWMSENLRVTHYNNGDLIGTTIPSTLDISSQFTPEFQWPYNGNDSNLATYGRLYTWYAINDVRGICPCGWHVPSDIEWTSLSAFLGGDSIAGGKMKERGYMHWRAPNTSADNSSGFSAFPSGYRTNNGNFFNLGSGQYIWSSSSFDSNSAWSRYMDYDYGYLKRYHAGDKSNGFSVRCIEDN